MDKQEEPQAPAAEPQTPAEQEAPAEQQAPIEEQAPIAEQAPAPEKKGPRFTTLKIVLLAFLINMVIFTCIDLIMTPLKGTTNDGSYDFTSNSIFTLVSIAVSIFISYLLVSNYNRKKYGYDPKAEKKIKNDAKRSGSIIVLTILFAIVISITMLILTGIWASNECAREGGNDCGIGWAWGFFIAPASIVTSIIVSPFIAVAIVNKSQPKE